MKIKREFELVIKSSSSTVKNISQISPADRMQGPISLTAKA